MSVNKSLWMVAVAASILTACGGGGSGDDSGGDTVTPPPATTLQGRLVARPVFNIGYRTASHQGATQVDGEFDYEPGETVTFFIGDLEFPAAAAAPLVTPLTLAGTEAVTDPQVVNMVRLLQTLDQDGDPSNGLSIAEAAKSAATPLNFTLPVEEFAVSDAVTNLIANAGQEQPVTELVSAAEALAQFEQALVADGIRSLALQGVWQMAAGPELAEVAASYMALLPNQAYFQVEVTANGQGARFEYGSYGLVGNRLSFAAQVDSDPESGADGLDLAISLAEDENSLSFTDDEGGDYTFGRTDLGSGIGLGGVWVYDNGSNDLAYLLLSANGDYVGVQAKEPDGDLGLEWGSYTSEGEAAVKTLTLDLQANSSDSLLAFEDESRVVVDYELVGDTLTFIFMDEGQEERASVSRVLFEQ